MAAQFAWFFLSLKGRISRQEFWLGYFLTLAVLVLVVPRLQAWSLALHRPASGPWYRNELAMALLSPRIAVFAAVAWPLTALYVKRLHDVGLSAWWLLPFVGALWLTTATGADQKNLLSAGLFGILGLAPGKRGDNRFGTDPIS